MLHYRLNIVYNRNNLMAKRAKTKENASSKQQVVKTISEKYPLLLLGATVVITAILLFFSILKNSFPANKVKISPTIVTASAQKTASGAASLKPTGYYTVQPGEHLWMIAEKTYGSGYNAYDIARANKIENPGVIYAGARLILPSVSPKTPTQGEVTTEIKSSQTQKVTMAATKYTVKSDDSLWKIAEAAYGDPYMWTRIAKANNLKNPNFIHVGNVFTIPR